MPGIETPTIARSVAVTNCARTEAEIPGPKRRPDDEAGRHRSAVYAEIPVVRLVMIM
jgi:hypothetical protein